MKKRILWCLTAILIGLNVLAILHSYRFTHFTDPSEEKTKNSNELSTGEKLNTLIFGISNPRPENKIRPSSAFETITLKSNKEIECWRITVENPKGTVILFHGFAGEKSSMLDKAAIFQSLGYNTFLVDFMGSGGSEGNQTTIGFFEAKQVKRCFDYIASTGETNIYLFGTSMGAVAIMKAIHDYEIKPNRIIIECPFGSMYQTVCARFRTMKIPTFPMASLLVFWGGVQNGFWAFGHNPTDYAKQIDCRTLLLYGAQDEKVSREEINTIFMSLNGEKRLKIYPDAGHENYLKKYKHEWTRDVDQFLGKVMPL